MINKEKIEQRYDEEKLEKEEKLLAEEEKKFNSTKALKNIKKVEKKIKEYHEKVELEKITLFTNHVKKYLLLYTILAVVIAVPVGY